jgi:CheY-like chemotaxis protein
MKPSLCSLLLEDSRNDAQQQRVRPAVSATILLADDDPVICRLASEILRKKGYTVLTAQDGEEALELAAHHAGRIDLLVTDIAMPRMDGIELATRLSEARPAMKVLYISGYAEQVMAHDGTRLRGVTLLDKPFTVEALAQTVRNVLDSASGETP